MIGQIYNSLIEALNKRERLPHFLLVIIDKDIVEDIDLFDYGASKELMGNLEWLIKQINILIQQRRSEIIEIKPGAIYTLDPKIVLVNMVRCPLCFPSGSQIEKVVSLCSKFYSTLNELAYNAELSILNVYAVETENHFDLLGNLNHFGQFTFWKQVNYLLEHFDKKKEGLEPFSRCSSSQHRNGSGDKLFHK